MLKKKKSHRGAEKPDLNGIAKDSAVCHLCGCSLHGSGYTGDGHAYCGENCYLKQRQFHLLEFEIDTAYLAFAEESVLREMVDSKCIGDHLNISK